MANTRGRRIINLPIRFRNDLDSIDSVRTPSPPLTYDCFSSLPGYARPVSETISQSTDVCPSCQMSNHRKRGRALVHHADFFIIVYATDRRRPNSQVFARGYAIAVFSQKIPPTLPHSRQQHLLWTNICRASRKSGAWTSLTCS